METLTVSEEKEKPASDEQALAKLLEAAFVLQEHNRELKELDLRLQLKRDLVEAQERISSAPAEVPRAPSPVPTTPQDYTLTLGKIVDTQHHIHLRKLGLNDAISLVAERVVEMGGASGGAVVIVNGQNVRYAATAGLKTLPVGTIMPTAKALSSVCIKTAQLLRCGDIASDNQVDTGECRRRGIQSLIAAPVFHEGEVAGALELYYSAPHAFTDQDIHTCQLMAGLVTEALVRDGELTWKKSLADERAALLNALEKLQPNLAALVEKPASKKTEHAAPAPARKSATYSCRKCGHPLLEVEQFCGECGTPRGGDYEPPSMQSKVASLWQMQEAAKKQSAAAFTNEGVAARIVPVQPERSELEVSAEPALEENSPFSIPQDFFGGEEPIHMSPDFERSTTELLENHSEIENQIEEVEEEDSVDEEATTVEEEASDSSSKPVSQKLTFRADWSSAAAAREFLEQLSSGNRHRSIVQFWNARRGDIYLAVAVILVACVIRWGVWNQTVTTGPQNPAAAAHKKAAADADLSAFDRMLIRLGLAEAPEPVEDRGNPATQVWVDQRTALYYCPGADLYGKTPKGKYTSQREAQLDQFEPAYRKTCK